MVTGVAIILGSRGLRGIALNAVWERSKERYVSAIHIHTGYPRLRPFCQRTEGNPGISVFEVFDLICAQSSADMTVVVAISIQSIGAPPR